MRARKWALAGVISLPAIAALAIGVGCGASGHEEAATEEAAEAEVREVVVAATEFAFEPSQITVKQGQPVRLVLQNDGTVEHDLQINGLHAQMMEAMDDDNSGEHVHASGEMLHVHTMSGETGRIEFIPEDTGTFEIVCTIPGHADAGMVGTLIVE